MVDFSSLTPRFQRLRDKRIVRPPSTVVSLSNTPRIRGGFLSSRTGNNTYTHPSSGLREPPWRGEKSPGGDPSRSDHPPTTLRHISQPQEHVDFSLFFFVGVSEGCFPLLNSNTVYSLEPMFSPLNQCFLFWTNVFSFEPMFSLMNQCFPFWTNVFSFEQIFPLLNRCCLFWIQPMFPLLNSTEIFRLKPLTLHFFLGFQRATTKKPSPI